jgi:cell division transport system permease protein
MRATVVATEVGQGLRRNLGLTLAVVLTVVVSGVLGGAAFLLGEQVNTMKGYWYDKAEVALFLCTQGDSTPSCNSTAVTPSQQAQIFKDLESLPQVEHVYYESQHQAWLNFEAQFKGTSLETNVPPNSLPSSFRVKLRDPTQFGIIDSAFSNRPGISQVEDQKQILDKLFKVLDALRVMALLIAAFALLAAILLIANSIRVTAFTRRRETGIMRLVGASNFSIQLPFLLETVLCAVTGAILACIALGAFKVVLVDKILAPALLFTPFIGWAAVWKAAFLVIAAAVIVAAGASMVTLRRYLRV